MANNTIREWDFEEWRYLGEIGVENVVGKVWRVRRQGWDVPD